MRYFLVVCLALLFVFVSLAPSALSRPLKRYDKRSGMCRILSDGKLDWESEPWGTGGIKFREVCKSCHSHNNSKGAKFIHAESYTSKAWNSIFAKRRKKCAKDGSWDVLSPEELRMVNDYLYRNGDWTYDPNDADSCG